MNVVVPPKAAARPPEVADCALIASLRPEVEVDVGVDAAGDDVLPARVDHALGREVDRLRRREGDDAAVLDADVNGSLASGETTVPPRIKTSSIAASPLAVQMTRRACSAPGLCERAGQTSEYHHHVLCLRPGPPVRKRLTARAPGAI